MGKERHLKRVLVTGAGGFIGHHLVEFLVRRGYWVRGVDIKHPQYRKTAAHDFIVADLRTFENCNRACVDIEEVYTLAADMGGIGFIESHKAQISRNNVLINAHMLEAARINAVSRFLYTSSACVYPRGLQTLASSAPLREEDAYPADPEDGYGWEKLYSERLCLHYREDYGLATRIARFHNIFGPLGLYDGGREKSPAALCRKIALAADGGEIEIWGDGQQQRSYCYIDDCLEGIYRLMRSDYEAPLNIGSDRMVRITELADIISRLAGKMIQYRYDVTKPQGVRSRNSDNTRLRQVLNWEPQIPLEHALQSTYAWIASDLQRTGRTPCAPAAPNQFTASSEALRDRWNGASSERD